MVKAIIFDFDGTITNRKVGAYKTYRGFFEEKYPEKSDIEIESLTQDAMLFEANGSHRYVAELLNRKYKFGDDFIDVFWDYYNSHIVGNMYLRPEVPQLLVKLKKDYKIALLTNGSTKIQSGKIDQVGVREYFDAVLTSEEIGYDKPDSRAFKAICDKLGVNMEESVYIGDIFTNDIYGADKANIKPIWFTEIGTVNSYKGTIIHDLSELQEVLKGL